jgi:hypothetical protein
LKHHPCFLGKLLEYIAWMLKLVVFYQALALLIFVDSFLGKNTTSTLQVPMQNGIHPFLHQFSLCP